MSVPGHKSTTDDWSSEAKLAVVIETALLPESELSQYCREIGLYPEQVKRWKQDSLQDFQNSETTGKEIQRQTKADKTQIKQLKKDLRRKEKALADGGCGFIGVEKKAQCALGRRREELTLVSERSKILSLIQ